MNKNLLLFLALISIIPAHAYDLPSFKKDANKIAKVAGKLGWTAGMSAIGVAGLCGAEIAPHLAYNVYNAFSYNQPYILGNGPDAFVLYPDHSYTFRNQKVNTLAPFIIAGAATTAVAGFIAYKAFKSAYTSIKSIGQ